MKTETKTDIISIDMARFVRRRSVHCNGLCLHVGNPTYNYTLRVEKSYPNPTLQELIRKWDSERELLRSAPESYPNSLK